MCIMESLTDRQHQEKLEQYLDAPIDQKYNKAIGIIKNLKVLIVLDNCDLIVESDVNSFRKLVEDITHKVENAKLLITSKSAITDLDTLNGKIHTLKKLTNSQVFEILTKKAKSQVDFKKELFILQKDFSSEDQAAVQSINKIDLEHDFFSMLNGHPLSVLLVSSLNSKKISLKKIYKTLLEIKTKKGIQSMTDLIFTLNVQTSLKFIMDQHFQAYTTLLCFALSPSGLTRKDCLEICPKKWDECTKVLLSHSMIQQKDVYEADSEFSNELSLKTLSSYADISRASSPRIGFNNSKVFTMDLSLWTIIQEGMSKTELEDADTKVVGRLVTLLTKLLEDYHNDAKSKYTALRKFEGNVWAALARMEQKQTKTGIYRRQGTIRSDMNSLYKDEAKKNDEGRWKIVEDAFVEDGKFSLKPNKASSSKSATLARKGTYRNKKRDLIDSCFNKNIKLRDNDVLKSNNQGGSGQDYVKNMPQSKFALMKKVADIL